MFEQCIFFRKSIHVLYFNSEQSFYTEDSSKKEAQSEHLKTAIYKANYYKVPKPVIKQTHYNLTQKKRMDQVEFMTRSFLVTSDASTQSWKLTPKRKKVLDYVCMGAELKVGEETIIAWFSPEIPISTGPGAYYGLPGVILGLEKNEEVFLLATSVELNVSEAFPSLPNKGQKLSNEKFDAIVQEKWVEFKQAREAEKNAPKKGKN